MDTASTELSPPLELNPLHLLVDSADEELSIHERLVLAAGNGDQVLVDQLLESGANTTARCSPHFGKFNDGKAEVLLLAHGLLEFSYGQWTDTRPAEYFARTALQAAADSGHKDIAALLLKAGADANASPAEWLGRTALQAAAEGGHQQLMKMLITAGADVNALPARNCGKTALHAAADGGNYGVLSLLIDAGVNTDGRNYSGQTVLHVAARGDVEKLRLLLKLGAFDINRKDYSGSTPLHIAVRGKLDSAVKVLLEEGANPEIRDNAGQTPLQVAVEKGFGNMMSLLLDGGANTDELRAEKVHDLFRRCRRADDQGAILLRQARPPSTRKFFKSTKQCTTAISDLHLEEWDLPSICLLSSKCGIRDPKETSFVDPRAYLEAYRYPGNIPRGTAVQWAWFTIGDESQGNPGYFSAFETGIPTRQEIIALKPANVILVGYVRFDFDSMDLLSIRSRPQKTEISWVMRENPHNHELSEGSLRSVHYRGTLNLKYLKIPHHIIEFFTWFLDDIDETWLELVTKHKLQLAQLRESQLEHRVAFRSLDTVELLHKYRQKYKEFHTNLQQHIRKSKDLLSILKCNDILDLELSNLQDTEGDDWKLKAIMGVSERIQSIESECGDAISDLGKEITEMIEYEFSLISAYADQYSVSISANMKKLSWVTFIFLPLNFASRLFGMNVNILASNPSWLYYIAFAFPLLTIVFLVWISFKFLPIEMWIEKFGSRWWDRARIRRKLKITTNKELRELSEYIRLKWRAASRISTKVALTSAFSRRRGIRHDDSEGAVPLSPLAVGGKR